MIRYLTHIQIDKKSYDQCIENASNSIVYANSWYLDIVAPGWELLEYDNYKAVMPLPKRKRIGIPYIFTPRYVQQLGIFAENDDPDITKAFLEKIREKFKLIELKCNEKNAFNLAPIVSKRTNYLLDIRSDYARVRKSYHRNCNRNIRKAVHAGLTIGEPISAEEFAGFIRKNLQDQIEGFTNKDVRLLANITRECMNRKAGEIVCVRDPRGNIFASGSFLFSKDRLIFAVCASTPEGHKKQAMYYLVDNQIKKYAGEYSFFDFSGSEIKGIAYFNTTFGSEPVFYPQLHINRLPWIVKLLAGKI